MHTRRELVCTLHHDQLIKQDNQHGEDAQSFRCSQGCSVPGACARNGVEARARIPAAENQNMFRA
jgi:hypothetical protein